MKQRVSLLFLLFFAAPAFSSSNNAPPPVSMPAPEAIPLRAEYHYRLSGSARPFVFFWISRDNVGGGRMTWRQAADGTRSLELLMGSDPARAPFHTNRWGYIREVVRGQDAELVAVKSDIEEDTIEQARASSLNGHNDRLIEFIRDDVSAGGVQSWSTVADIQRDGVSYRDLGFVLGRMGSVDSWEERHLDKRPPETRPGFLVSFTELMQATVDSLESGTPAVHGRTEGPIGYIHRAKLYQLRQENIELRRTIELGGRKYERAIHSRFQIRNTVTGDTSTFVVTYGTEGALAAVPIQIVYQPRWWLRTELTLDDRGNDAPRGS